MPLYIILSRSRSLVNSGKNAMMRQRVNNLYIFSAQYLCYKSCMYVYNYGKSWRKQLWKGMRVLTIGMIILFSQHERANRKIPQKEGINQGKCGSESFYDRGWKFQPLDRNSKAAPWVPFGIVCLQEQFLGYTLLKSAGHL